MQAASKRLFLAQYEDGFRYTSDTMVLYDFVSGFKPKGALLDVGAGCGVLGLLLARDFDVRLSMVESEPRQALLCRKNASDNGIECDVLQTDALKLEGGGFDMIVSNPPYYDAATQKSSCDFRKRSLYADALEFGALLKKSVSLLKPKGEFIFCYDARALQTVFTSLQGVRGCAMTHLRFVYGSENKPSKLLLARIQKSSKAHLCVLPPLVMQKGGSFGSEAKTIFEKANCESVKAEG